jgi:hypothetical protein
MSKLPICKSENNMTCSKGQILGASILLNTYIFSKLYLFEAKNANPNLTKKSNRFETVVTNLIKMVMKFNTCRNKNFAKKLP